MLKKEMYLKARVEGKSNEEIAKLYNVKLETINRAIGTDKGREKVMQPIYIGTNPFGDDDEEIVVFDETVSEAVKEPQEGKKVRKTIISVCCDCKEEYTITPAEQKFYTTKGLNFPKRCEKCRKKRHNFIECECIDCGDTFKIKLTQKEFFEKLGLTLPKRCPECIKIKAEHNRKLAAEKGEQIK